MVGASMTGWAHPTSAATSLHPAASYPAAMLRCCASVGSDLGSTCIRTRTSKMGGVGGLESKKAGHAIASGKREKGTSIFNFSLPNPKPGGLVTNDTLHMHDAMKKTMKLHVNFGCNAERRQRGACVCSLLATERLSTGSERSRGCGSSSIIIYIICRHASKANLS